MKRISAIMACVLSVMLVFTGCDYNEKKLYNAFKKSLEVTSRESDTDISVTLDTEGFPEEQQLSISIVKMILEDSNISIHTKLDQNKPKTSVKTYMDTQFVIGGIGMGVEYWSDYKKSSNKNDFLQVAKFPSIMMISPNEELAGKQYIILSQEDNNDSDINANSKLILGLQDKLNKFLKEYALQYNPNLKLVKNRGRKTIDGKTAYVYELSLDNKSLSQLINYSVNNLMDNEEALEIFRECVDVTLKMIQKPQEEIDEVKESIDAFLKNLDENKPQFKQMINHFTDKLYELELLGEKGIAIQYAIDKDGYIVNESGLIDLNIDLEKIEGILDIGNQAENQDSNYNNYKVQTSGVIKLGIEFNRDIYNINQKVEIDIPKLTEDNSININELNKARSESLSEWYSRDI